MHQSQVEAILVNVLCTLAFISFFFIFCLLNKLSQRIEQAPHAPPYYTLYYIAMVFVFMAILARITSFVSESAEFSQVVGYAFFSVAVTLGFFVTYRYWSWIIPALRG